MCMQTVAYHVRFVVKRNPRSWHCFIGLIGRVLSLLFESISAFARVKNGGRGCCQLRVEEAFCCNSHHSSPLRPQFVERRSPSIDQRWRCFRWKVLQTRDTNRAARRVEELLRSVSSVAGLPGVFFP